MAPSRSAERALLVARLAAQRLIGPPAATVREATRHLLAVQGQDPRGARLALRPRVAGGHASAVDRALTEERSLVVTWVNRGTLHLIAAEDEPLLHALTTPQHRGANERRLGQLGVTEVAAARGVAALVRALGEHGPLTRAGIRAALERARVPTAGQALVHLLFRATLDGLIVRGPMVGNQQAFALVGDWLGERPKLDRDRALPELARRYLVGHGPADDRDLARWAGITLRDARAGLNAIAGELDQRLDGLVHLRRNARARGNGLDEPSRDGAATLAPRLLGPFDPLLLGWRSRALVLDGAEDVITVNGIIKPIVLVGGRARGTWTMARGDVALQLWQPQARATMRALEREAAAVEAYLAYESCASGP